MSRTTTCALGLALVLGVSACEQRPTAPAVSNSLGDGNVAVASVMTASRASHTPPPYAAGAAVLESREGSAMMSVASAGTDFAGFYRYPAEEKTWMAMEADSAYFRDAFVSGDEAISGATDGQTWYAKAIGPRRR